MPQFPPKYWYGNFNALRIDTRKNSLRLWLEQLLNHPDVLQNYPDIRSSLVLRGFSEPSFKIKHMFDLLRRLHNEEGGNAYLR